MSLYKSCIIAHAAWSRPAQTVPSNSEADSASPAASVLCWLAPCSGRQGLQQLPGVGDTIHYIDYQETQATQHSTVDIIIQWDLSVEDTTGTQLAVLYREVALSQRYICTQLYAVGTADSVLI